MRRANRDLVKRNGGASVAAKQATAMATLLNSAALVALADGDSDSALKFSREAEACRRRVQAELDRDDKRQKEERERAEAEGDDQGDEPEDDDALDAETQALLDRLRPDPESAPDGVLPLGGTQGVGADEYARETPPRSRNGGCP